MAKGKKGGSYEMVLEGRHILGIFFAVVVVCALFFTLGFVLGRGQAAPRQAASPPAQEKPAPAQPGQPAAGDLSFYDRVEGKQPPEEQPAASAESAPAEAKPKESAATAKTIYLQVSALTQEPDAKRLAQELQKLGFPSVIRPPRDDRFYRVLVGPFENDELAAAAKRRLESRGFKGIIKR